MFNERISNSVLTAGFIPFNHIEYKSIVEGSLSNGCFQDILFDRLGRPCFQRGSKKLKAHHRGVKRDSTTYESISLYLNGQEFRLFQSDLLLLIATLNTKRSDLKSSWIFEMVRFLTSIRRTLLSVSLDLHATGDSRVSFPSGEISDVNESVVSGSQQVDDTEVDDIGS